MDDALGFEPDPSWSSPFNVLAYSMMGPPSVVAGDVQMRDGSVTLDVIRFNPAGTGGNPLYPASILFYSDNLDGFDALADTPGPPPQHTNVVYIDEVGTESVNYGLYTPSNGQPGFVPGYTVSYKFISHTPEPACPASSVRRRFSVCFSPLEEVVASEFR